MRKDLLGFLLKLLGFTLVLGYVWFAGLQRAYPDLIEPVAAWFFELSGVRRWWLVLTVEHFTNLVPYLALIFASPGFFTNWKRTLLALLSGLSALVLAHIVMSIAIYYIVEAYSMSRQAYRLIIPIYIVNDALPLVLWLLLYPELLPRLFRFVKFGRVSDAAE